MLAMFVSKGKDLSYFSFMITHIVSILQNYFLIMLADNGFIFSFHKII